MIKNILDIAEMKFPIDGNFDLIMMTNNLSFSSILDIGMGDGGASLFFALHGKDVSSLGLELNSYDAPI
ncbi:MAG: hypothetical protein IE909_19440, partial [Campylobacterales bacterium]|nr:hypothetical protein [Campylobacterales bacterium]